MPRESGIVTRGPLVLQLHNIEDEKSMESSFSSQEKNSLILVEKAVEVYHDKEYRSKRWRFPSYNFTLSVIWSPLLIKAAIFEDMHGVSTSDLQLHLDKLYE